MFIFGVSCHEMSKTAGSNLPLNSLIEKFPMLKKETIISKSRSVRINQRANGNKIKMENLTPSTKDHKLFVLTHGCGYFLSFKIFVIQGVLSLHLTISALYFFTL